ncbi:MAG TPA: hypothetical protein VLF87_02590 [Patescibacteria group bacterium]|nr:hypothetical protein [Patescibacteria group bacterium]
MKVCNRVYERIATRELPSRMVFENVAHGIMVLLDPMPVAEGHLAVASLVCVPSVDEIHSRMLRNKMFTAARYAGLVLAQAFPDAPYIGEMTASNQIRHPHIHRVPGDEEANWLKRFSKLDDWPRLNLSDAHMDDIQGRLTTDAVAEALWEQCNAEILAQGEPDTLTGLALAKLGLIPSV